MTRLSRWERVCVITLVLTAWALRWVALMEVPPGWRDDDLIELYTFSLRIAAEGPQLYLPGASGHEPLYHSLRAPLVALAGVNAASARLMAAGAGTLAVLLTWAIARRLFTFRHSSDARGNARQSVGVASALLAGALVSVSFWGLLYSRVAIRHMGALPWMLLAIYWGWRLLRDQHPPRGALWGLALGTSGAILTYYAGRLMPVLLIGLFFVAAPRAGRWRRYFLGLGLGIALSAPMFIAAAGLPGADARVSEVGVPIVALLGGDLRPLLQTTWTTLGMFHAKGDPEWLYNYSERPVFDLVTAGIFYLSLALALVRWHRPENRLLPLWLVIGLSPAFISLPPSSYGHTILAQPAVYLLLASLVPTLAQWIGERTKWRVWAPTALGLLLLITVGTRDLWGYFHLWPSHPMMRFLYRADYRALSDALCDNTELNDIAIGSMLYGVWDKVALKTDCSRPTWHPRWVNPARAVVFAAGRATPLYLQDEGDRHPEIEALLRRSHALDAPHGMIAYQIEPVPVPPHAITQTAAGDAITDHTFAKAITLEAVALMPSQSTDQRITLATWWHIDGELPLPPEELISQPPPPGVYSGPRLKVFAHLKDGDQTLSIDDGLWVDPYSLRPGDTLLQFHDFELPSDLDEEALAVQLGLYDPLTGERWRTPNGVDHLVIPLDTPSLD